MKVNKYTISFSNDPDEVMDTQITLPHNSMIMAVKYQEQERNFVIWFFEPNPPEVAMTTRTFRTTRCVSDVEPGDASAIDDDLRHVDDNMRYVDTVSFGLDTDFCHVFEVV